MKQQRWIDSSPRSSRNPQMREDLADEIYNANLRMREPLFRFVIQNFKIDPNDPMDYLNYPITLLGYRSVPLGIELSQWGYDVTLLLKDATEKRFADRNAEVHNGKIKHKVYNYYEGMCRSRLLIWVDDDLSMPQEVKLEWVNYLKSRCQVLVFALRRTKKNHAMLGQLNNCMIKSEGAFYFAIIYP